MDVLVAKTCSWEAYIVLKRSTKIYIYIYSLNISAALRFCLGFVMLVACYLHSRGPQGCSGPKPMHSVYQYIIV